MSIVSNASRGFVVRRDFATMRQLLARIRQSEVLAPLKLFRRRNYHRMLDYLEQRSEERRAAQIPITILPAEFDGVTARVSTEGSLFGVTCVVSFRGLGFTHDQPCNAVYALVEFDSLDVDPIRALLEVRWSNFEQSEEQYMSGGRFLGVVVPKSSLERPETPWPG